MRYIKLNENIALAKSILRKNGISEDNEDCTAMSDLCDMVKSISANDIMVAVDDKQSW